ATVLPLGSCRGGTWPRGTGRPAGAGWAQRRQPVLARSPDAGWSRPDGRQHPPVQAERRWERGAGVRARVVLRAQGALELQGDAIAHSFIVVVAPAGRPSDRDYALLHPHKSGISPLALSKIESRGRG